MRTATSTRRRPRLTVALVGADGAGKSTVSGRLSRSVLPMPLKTIYMGVNLDASSLMLPTTRLLLAAKRALGGRPDLVASTLSTPAAGEPAAGRRGWRRSTKDGVRMGVWMLEEWLRQLVATAYTARGFVVVFDRHFVADYYHADVVAGGAERGLPRRLHGWVLVHAYPKPDLVICLDAPAEVLYLRKPESSVEWLEHRRRQYLDLGGVVPALVVLDADRPVDVVTADVVQTICAHWEARA